MAMSLKKEHPGKWLVDLMSIKGSPTKIHTRIRQIYVFFHDRDVDTFILLV